MLWDCVGYTQPVAGGLESQKKSMNLINYRMCGVEPLHIASQISKVKSADLVKLSAWNTEYCPEALSKWNI